MLCFVVAALALCSHYYAAVWCCSRSVIAILLRSASLRSSVNEHCWFYYNSKQWRNEP